MSSDNRRFRVITREDTQPVGVGSILCDKDGNHHLVVLEGLYYRIMSLDSVPKLLIDAEQISTQGDLSKYVHTSKWTVVGHISDFDLIERR